MPFEQVSMTLYDLHHDAARWKKALSQITPSVTRDARSLDSQMRTLLTDANDSLADIEKSTTSVVATPKVAEIIAIAFDLESLQRTVASIGIIAISARLAPDRVVQLEASPTLKLNAERWHQITQDLSTEIQPYRDGWESYTFHLGQAVDESLSRK
jgi:hypothetical protein